MTAGGGFVRSAEGGDDEMPKLPIRSSSLATSPLANLTAALADLALPRSVQPPNPLRLAREVGTSFAPRSDIAPLLVAALRPTAAGLYAAWRRVEMPPARLRLFALRLKAALFASSYAGKVVVMVGEEPVYTPPTLATVYTPGTPEDAASWLDVDLLPLDGLYDQIKPGSFVAIEWPDPADDFRPQTSFHKVIAAAPRSLNTRTGFAAKVTVLRIAPSWFTRFGDLSRTEVTLRETVVYAQAEELSPVDEPLDVDIAGATVELDGVFDGIEPGRWIIVSGDRTDVTNVAGVAACEAAMIAAVSQGSSAPLSVPFPVSEAPFTTIFYTTDASATGDRLVVGRLRPKLVQQGQGVLAGWDLPHFAGQQYEEQILLGPDPAGQATYAVAYVPSARERSGIYDGFAGLLVDPASGRPYTRSRIPAEDLAAGIFAWRIATPRLNTSLTLANALAYRYDRNTATIYGNVADATQGQSTGEILGDGDATQSFASFALHQTPLTYLPAPTPSGVASTLQVRVNELAWHEAQGHFVLDAGQRGFVAREDDAGRTRVTFGDGAHGARLPTGTANIKATYRYGMGSSGNVAAGQISQLATQPLGLKAVLNPLPATGGADADRPDQVRANTPVATLALDRLVSVRDYGDFARNFAGVGKVSARALSDGVRDFVHVTIAGVDDIPVDAEGALARNLRAAFAVNGDPFQSVELAARRLRLIVVAATVGILDDHLWEDVAPAVRLALLAGFGFTARALGQPAYASEAVAAMQAVTGVSYVDLTVFDSVGEDSSAGALASLARTLTARPFVGAELARVDAGAEPGSAGRILPAELAILTPDIPDTILLRQAAR